MPDFALCSSAAIVIKAGVGANVDAVASGGILAQFYLEAEGEFVQKTNRDWVKAKDTLNSSVSGAIAGAISAIAGNMLASYDPALYFSREVFQTQLDVNRDQANKIMADMKDFDASKLRPV